MRVEPFGVGSFVHAMKRGARGLPIVRTESDRIRFARLLYFLNDSHKDENWESKTAHLEMFERPSDWPERMPLTRVLGWVLMPNHFHLLLEEIQEGGIAKFMQRLCGSMSAHFNAKYKEKGSIFQGGYKGRVIDSDQYLRQLIPYVMVKNVFELYPGGNARAMHKEFERVWQWGATSYAFSSLPEYAGKRAWPITESGIIGELFSDKAAFKRHAREILSIRNKIDERLQSLSFE